MRKTILALALLIVAGSANAQKPGPDPFADALFDPQLVLRNAEAIGLSQAQRRTIFDELKAAQIALAPLQVEMTEPALELVELLGQTKVDEARVLAKTDQVLRIENEVKKRQTALLVRVKNALTSEQQSKLRALRKATQKGDGDVELRLPN
ncbi:MAG TPA: periplasmic heavy metal sensor [Gemmatimonadaceae bacterium]|nr:periplasmic heavy metal sensor [Gemmatimonadaceae bacterium]